MNSPSSNLQTVLDRSFADLRQRREAFSAQLAPRETGTITQVSTGIAMVSGLPGVGYDELIAFPGGVFGIAFNVTHLNQAGALVHVYTDGSVLVNHGGTEMGQGLYVKVAQVVAEEFAGIEGIDEAHLFGSWAARYAGEIGRAPGDIDVLVIGAPDRDVAYEAAERASRRLAHEVNVTFRSREWWAEGVDGFHTEVLTRPRVQVLPVAQVKP